MWQEPHTEGRALSTSRSSLALALWPESWLCSNVISPDQLCLPTDLCIKVWTDGLFLSPSLAQGAGPFQARVEGVRHIRGLPAPTRMFTYTVCL